MKVKILTICVLILIVLIMLFAVCKVKPNERQSGNESVVTEPTTVSTDNYIKWNLDGDPENYLLYSVEPKASDPESMELIIRQKDQKEIFREEAVNFGDFESVDMLRKSRCQLVIKSINNGGNGVFFQILDYETGKVVSLTDVDDTLYSGYIQILPQYQKPNYYSLPLQVFLNTNVADPSAEANILRFADGKYRSVGKFSQSEAAKYIEGNIHK